MITHPRGSRLLFVAILAVGGLIGWNLLMPPAQAADPKPGVGASPGASGAPKPTGPQITHFFLGVTSSPGDHWITDTRAQGAQFDVRYQYLAGGVNTGKNNWQSWNQPAGQFVLSYFKDSDRMGVVPCMTYYQMYQSLPCGAKGDEAKGNKGNLENAETMKAYLEDFKVLMIKAGEFGKPVIIHHDPDLWGYMCISPVFAPNLADKVKVLVKSSGFAEGAAFEDTAAGFGKCLVALRDKYAPKALLGWHASKWGNPNPKTMAAFMLQCGRWDIIFTDPSDRDAEWKVAHGTKPADAWWTEKSFASFRDWSGELHRLTGLPLVAWQIPMGNTYMASCNNTDGHYMDNRVEYFLEGYPANKHIAEWASVGYIGLLFGGGAGGCTDVRDGKKDGITNPTPVAGNKGEKAAFADDDGGYLRLRGANYYTKGPLPLK